MVESWGGGMPGFLLQFFLKANATVKSALKGFWNGTKSDPSEGFLCSYFFRVRGFSIEIWYRYEVMTFQFLDLEKSEEAAENYCVLGNLWYEW